jgi:hypothetical protein
MVLIIVFFIKKKKEKEKKRPPTSELLLSETELLGLEAGQCYIRSRVGGFLPTPTFVLHKKVP